MMGSAIIQARGTFAMLASTLYTTPPYPTCKLSIPESNSYCFTGATSDLIPHNHNPPLHTIHGHAWGNLRPDGYGLHATLLVAFLLTCSHACCLEALGSSLRWNLIYGESRTQSPSSILPPHPPPCPPPLSSPTTPSRIPLPCLPGPRAASNAC